MIRHPGDWLDLNDLAFNLFRSIITVIVIPEQRGKGLGRAIMKLTEDYVRRYIRVLILTAEFQGGRRKLESVGVATRRGPVHLFFVPCRKGFTRCHLSTHDKQEFYKRIGYSVSNPVCGVTCFVDFCLVIM